MLAKNLNYLRKKNKLSQEALAKAIKIPRTTLGDYERGQSEPNINMLIKLAAYFDVNLDQLIKEDLSHRDYEIIRNNNLRVLAISVDKENNGNIELVDTKAEAGYLESYQNPEYIRDLPKINFPNIPEGTFRGFEIQGQSMLPMESGSIIISSYLERIEEIKDDRTYIIISERDGLVYKRVRKDEGKQQLILCSDNPSFLPYSIPYHEVSEIWQYFAHLSFSDAAQSLNHSIEERLSDIQKRIGSIEQKIDA